MDGAASPELERVLGLLPSVPCVLTSAFEHRRGGVLVKRVVQCADEPLCIAIAVPTGHRIATLIRDSHTFALCVLDKSSRLLLRKFDGREDGDPFDTLETIRLVSGAPIPARALAAFDCEVVRHYDLEADHEVYVGQVLAARALQLASPLLGERPGASPANSNGVRDAGANGSAPQGGVAPVEQALGAPLSARATG